MPSPDLSERLKEFIFRHVDSVELLEVLFLLRRDRTQYWAPQEISDELRSSPASIVRRLQHLKGLGLAEEKENTDPPLFRYSSKDAAMESLAAELLNEYNTRKYRIYELVFSPLKKARDFADAFHLGSRRDKKEDK